jgi:ribonucleoside-diphosphate reductase alpha chain
MIETVETQGDQRRLMVERELAPKDTDDIFSLVQWEKRSAQITNDKGEVIFEQNDVEVPVAWSQLATNVVVSKYFYGKVNTPARETSVKQLITRVADTIAVWGAQQELFDTETSSQNFRAELTYILLMQMAAFNSPVWFNVGLSHQYGHSAETEGPYTWRAILAGCVLEQEGGPVPVTDAYKYPQCSACFIQHVDDTLEDIMRLATSEAILFKHGSGTGTDLSTLRSTYEGLSGGGTPSGPLSFMKIYDAVAGVIKSGGKTRRAAKMQSLGVWHPDIMKFIQAKWHEEKKAHALIDAGYDGSMDGDAYTTACFQNANLSVRVTDKFMHAVDQDDSWEVYGVRDAELKWTRKAKEIWDEMGECAYHCGDPGIQYHDTINKWHTCPNDGAINASNPCSEYMFLDDTACNLASINLLKFLDDDGVFNTNDFMHVCDVMIVAQEILVDNASYPSEEICRRSHQYRTLGLGYANLGALLMRLGLPYDSDDGRALAGAVTSLMGAVAYECSSKLAEVLGPFERYEANRAPMLRVMAQHLEAAKSNQLASVNARSSMAHAIARSAADVWAGVANHMEENPGFRNAQVTVLAPTGTIAFLMDCDTTGVEPDIALVKYKALAGGGMLKIVNQSVDAALMHLGYSDVERSDIIQWVDEHDTVEGCNVLKEEHLPVFDCAFKPMNGVRSIHYDAHIRMMAATQPFLSGAISKTVNMPEHATPAEIVAVYQMGWDLGLKAVAIYRENSKRIQPLNVDANKGEGHTSRPTADEIEELGDPALVSPVDEHNIVSIMAKALEDAQLYPVVAQALTDQAQVIIRQVQNERREKLPDTRSAITHKFEVQGHKGYINIGIYDDGRPGEMFITMNKEGSTVRGIMDGLGVAVSVCFQYGVPLKVLSSKFSHTRFEPSGFTKNKQIPIAKSLLDYIFRWMEISFPEGRYVGYSADHATPTAVIDGTIRNGDQSFVVARSVHVESGSATAITDIVQPAINATHNATQVDTATFQNQEDAPACPNCGSITVRNGACYRCHNCGESLGCS